MQNYFGYTNNHMQVHAGYIHKQTVCFTLHIRIHKLMLVGCVLCPIDREGHLETASPFTVPCEYIFIYIYEMSQDQMRLKSETFTSSYRQK